MQQEICKFMSEENMKGPDSNHPQAIIEWKNHQITTLRTALAKSEAERAVMREALRGCHLHIGAFDKYYQGSNLCKANEAALSSTSGSRLMERMRLLEKVVEAAEKVVADDIEDAPYQAVNFHKLVSTIRELDALQSKDTL